MDLHKLKKVQARIENMMIDPLGGRKLVAVVNGGGGAFSATYLFLHLI